MLCSGVIPPHPGSTDESAYPVPTVFKEVGWSSLAVPPSLGASTLAELPVRSTVFKEVDWSSLAVPPSLGASTRPSFPTCRHVDPGQLDQPSASTRPTSPTRSARPAQCKHQADLPNLPALPVTSIQASSTSPVQAPDRPPRPPHQACPRLTITVRKRCDQAAITLRFD